MTEDDKFAGPTPGITAPAEDDRWKDMLVWKRAGRGGQVLEPNSLVNTIVLLQYSDHFRGVFVLNEFSDEIIIARCPPWEQEEKFKIHRLEHDDIVRCAAALEYRGLTSSIERVANAIAVVARQSAIHPMRDWLQSLEWDGEKRLHEWLPKFAGATAQPAEYTGPIGTKWMVAAVKRVMEPGAKFDHMLVLEGPQNIGKSTILRTLATVGPDFDENGKQKPGAEIEYFTDAIRFSNMDKPASVIAMQGRIIIEFPELAGLARKEIEEVKHWITIQTDEVQKKYKNEITCYPRQFVLAGTTNEESWLRDHTGNRRFLPVKCGNTKIDVPGLKAVRNQLWAEAMWMYQDGFEVWIDYGSELEQLASSEQSARMVEDVWTNNILDVVKDMPEVAVSEVLQMLNVDTARRDENMARRVGRVLRHHGWTTAQKWVAGRNKKIFFNPDERFKYRREELTGTLLPGHPVHDPDYKPPGDE